METYNTVNEYEKSAKIGDYITFEGHGIVDGIKNSSSKHDFYKVVKIHPLTVEAEIIGFISSILMLGAKIKYRERLNEKIKNWYVIQRKYALKYQ